LWKTKSPLADSVGFWIPYVLRFLPLILQLCVALLTVDDDMKRITVELHSVAPTCDGV
jgi:hypothetical protein